jgi:hypothetical protein
MFRCSIRAAVWGWAGVLGCWCESAWRIGVECAVWTSGCLVVPYYLTAVCPTRAGLVWEPGGDFGSSGTCIGGDLAHPASYSWGWIRASGLWAADVGEWALCRHSRHSAGVLAGCRPP